MTSDVGQALLMIGGIICLMVFAIWAFWFLERFRGGICHKAGRSKAIAPRSCKSVAQGGHDAGQKSGHTYAPAVPTTVLCALVDPASV